MLGSQADLLKGAIDTVDQWRTTATNAGIELMQINLKFPDSRQVVLKWDDQAIDNEDGTFTGDWLVDT